MNPSNFQKVLEFNHQFGITLFGQPVPKIFDKDPKLIQYRMNLIQEEYRELQQAVGERDYVETIDALSDLLYVIYGMGASIGMDMDKAFDIVHNSNMSKLCKSKEEALDTIKWYQEHPELGYDSPKYRKSTDDKYYVVYNESTKKILKSIHYKPADFSALL